MHQLDGLSTATGSLDANDPSWCQHEAGDPTGHLGWWLAMRHSEIWGRARQCGTRPSSPMA